jgi:hypothetical protein
VGLIGFDQRIDAGDSDKKNGCHQPNSSTLMRGGEFLIEIEKSIKKRVQK